MLRLPAPLPPLAPWWSAYTARDVALPLAVSVAIAAVVWPVTGALL